MDKQEFLKVISLIRTSYPGSNALPITQESISSWFIMLEDIDYEVCKKATVELISTNKFPPTIAEIRERSACKTNGSIKTPGEAWEIVIRAIQKCGRDEPKKAYELMDEAIIKTVKQLGYTYLCNSENQVADRANFMKLYEVIAKEKQFNSQLPGNIRLENQSAAGYIEGNL